MASVILEGMADAFIFISTSMEGLCRRENILGWPCVGLFSFDMHKDRAKGFYWIYHWAGVELRAHLLARSGLECDSSCRYRIVPRPS